MASVNLALTSTNKTLTKQLEEAQSCRQSLQNELSSSSQFAKELEERIYTANKTSLDLLKHVRDLEVETSTLKNYIIDLKARVAVYVPVKDDPVDQKIADFINNYPDRNRLKIMFLREKEGVYDFGSKKVNVRIEKDRILIRVGGGYLSIDEFIDQFTAVELEKIERRDPLKRFSERVLLTKTVEGRDAAGRLTSPT